MTDTRNLFDSEVMLVLLNKPIWLRSKVKADKRNLFD
jgi:hypothetical protein